MNKVVEPVATATLKEERELLLTTAKILRAHLRDTLPIRQTLMQDIQELNRALRPFEGSLSEEGSDDGKR